MTIKNFISKIFDFDNENKENKEETKTLKDNSFDTDIINNLLTQIHNLKVNDKLARKDIKHLKEVIVFLQGMVAVFVAIIGIMLPIIFSIYSSNVDKNFNKIESKFDIIIQQLNSQKEINSLQIQKDVILEVKNISKILKN